jgi:membrane-bound serine protease (ClpP class)
MKYVRSLIVALGVILGASAPVAADIFVMDFSDEVQPASAEFVSRALRAAEDAKAEALIITLNTPGGLATSMQEIVERILASRVPVVVYVSPSGAKAASAGFVILISADVAAMAPGTNTGAAHPVAIGLDEERNKTMFLKMENDASAYVRSIADRRGRNVELAVAAVRESKSYDVNVARQEKLIEIVAQNLDDLLKQLDGRQIRRWDGQEITLHTKGQRIVRVEPTTRERLLSFLANPNIALILGAIGLLCLYFEFNHPGAIIPAVVGGIALVLALYGFHLLPIDITGVVLIILALGLFIAEAKVQGFGILGVGGIVSMVIGAMILIDAPDPAIQIHKSVALAVAIPMAIIMIVVLRLAMRSREQKVVTGDLGMVGLVGVAETDIDPEGQIFVRGELWQAVSETRIVRRERVRVIGVDGLKLQVEAVHPTAPRQASIIEVSSENQMTKS